MEKISPGKQYDYFGEINAEVDPNVECAKRLDKLMDVFGLKVIGEQYRTVFLRGIGSIELTFVDYCEDVKNLKTWLRTGINSS